MIKILIVDDHTLVRSALRQILDNTKGMKVIAEASDGEAALALCEDLKPDVVLMDIQMPVMDGLEATRKLHQMNPKIKVLIVTGYLNDLFPARLLQTGAAGYMLKTAEPNEMISAIHAVASGQRYLNPEIASQLALKRLTNSVSPMDGLADRELDVVRCISTGMSILEISQKLTLSTKTINSYRYRIFEKLKIKNDVELTRLSMQHGLIPLDQLILQRRKGKPSAKTEDPSTEDTTCPE